MNGRRTVKGRLDCNGHESPCENQFIQKYYHDEIYVLQKQIYRIRSYLKNHGGLGGCYPPNRPRLMQSFSRYGSFSASSNNFIDQLSERCKITITAVEERDTHCRTRHFCLNNYSLNEKKKKKQQPYFPRSSRFLIF